MKRMMMLVGLALAAVPLAGCAEDYGYGGSYGYSAYYGPRGLGWYDGYYGPVYDGYWGNGGAIYYYRMHERDRWRRDEGRHFRYGERSPGDGWRRYGRADRDHGRRGHDRDDD